MSQKIVDVLKGISQAAAGMYDGAVDENGEPVKIGLKREEGDLNLEARVMDGFNIRIQGTKLLVILNCC